MQYKKTGWLKKVMKYSQYYNLSSTTFLYLTRDEYRKTTILKRFSLSNLNHAEAEKRLDGCYRLLCLFDDGAILLQKEYGGAQSLIKLCPKTLETLSSQAWTQGGDVAAVGNHRFFVIKHQSYLNKNTPTSCDVVFYEQQGTVFIESHTAKLPLTAQTAYANISSVVNLGKNRYGCHLRGHNTDEFSIQLFDVDIENKTISPAGMIQPKIQQRGAGSAASGCIELLPKGQFLTYHECHDHVQIWDSQTLQCIREWSWSEVGPQTQDFSIWCLKVKPISLTGNVLLYQSNKLYLFNVYSDTTKAIQLKDKLSYFGPLHVLPNGEVLAFIESYLHKDLNSVLHFDTQELVAYRQGMGAYNFGKQRAYRFFDTTIELPVELTEHILSYAFTGETLSAASQQASQDAFDNDNKPSACVIV